MLAMYHYEENVMRSSCEAFKSDIHVQMLRREAANARALRVDLDATAAVKKSSFLCCDICHKHLAVSTGLGTISHYY